MAPGRRSDRKQQTRELEWNEIWSKQIQRPIYLQVCSCFQLLLCVLREACFPATWVCWSQANDEWNDWNERNTKRGHDHAPVLWDQWQWTSASWSLSRGVHRAMFVSCCKPMPKVFPLFLFKWIREKDFLVWIGFVRRCSWTVGHLKYWNRTPFFEWCIGCTVERKAHLGCQDILLGAPTLSDWHGQIITLKGTCRHQARMTLPFAILGRERPCAQTV